MSETPVPAPDAPDTPDVDDAREGAEEELTVEETARSAPEVGNDQDPASYLRP